MMSRLRMAGRIGKVAILNALLVDMIVVQDRWIVVSLAEIGKALTTLSRVEEDCREL